MANQTKVLQLRDGDRQVLEVWLRQRTLPRRQLERAQIVLGAADGLSSRRLVSEIGVARPTVLQWIRRYEAEGLRGIERDRPRSGRPRTITAEVEHAVIEKTIQEKPPAEVSTH
jgi:transposase